MTVRRKMNLYATEAQEFLGYAWEAGAGENDGGNDLNVRLLQQFFKTKRPAEREFFLFRRDALVKMKIQAVDRSAFFSFLPREYG